MKFYTLFVLIFLFSSYVHASVGIATQKDNIDVPISSTGIFQYEIQTIGISDAQNCTFSFQESLTLDVKFDKPSLIVPPNTRTQIFGTAKTTKDTKIGSYNFNFCVLCSSAQQKSSLENKVAQSICNIPLKVNVIEKTSGNKISKQQTKIPTFLLIIGVIIILSIIILLLKELKHKNLYR